MKYKILDPTLRHLKAHTCTRVFSSSLFFLEDPPGLACSWLPCYDQKQETPCWGWSSPPDPSPQDECVLDETSELKGLTGLSDCTEVRPGCSFLSSFRVHLPRRVVREMGTGVGRGPSKRQVRQIQWVIFFFLCLLGTLWGWIRVKLNDKTKRNEPSLPFLGFVLRKKCNTKSKRVDTAIVALHSLLGYSRFVDHRSLQAALWAGYGYCHCYTVEDSRAQRLGVMCPRWHGQ